MDSSEEKDELLTLQQRLESKIQVGLTFLALDLMPFNLNGVLTE